MVQKEVIVRVHRGEDRVAATAAKPSRSTIYGFSRVLLSAHNRRFEIRQGPARTWSLDNLPRPQTKCSLISSNSSRTTQQVLLRSPPNLVGGNSSRASRIKRPRTEASQ